MALMLMAFLVLINLRFPAIHMEILYSLIYQVDKHLINFFCSALHSAALSSPTV